MSFAQPWRKLDLLFSVFDLYHRPFDIACFALAVAAVGWAYWRRVEPALAPALMLPLAVLALLYLAAPAQMLGASGIDRRFPLALALVLFAGSAWVAPPRSGRWKRGLLAAALLLFLLQARHRGGDQLAGERPRLHADLAAGASGRSRPASRIAVAAPPDATNVTATPLVHLPVLGAALGDAFVPTLFAIPGQQPIAIAPAVRDLAAGTGLIGVARADPKAARSIRDLGVFLGHYDYVAVIGVRPFDLPARAGTGAGTWPSRGSSSTASAVDSCCADTYRPPVAGRGASR